MAKIKTEELLSKISELPIEEQVSLLTLIKGKVADNIRDKKDALKQQTIELDSTLEKING